MSASLIWEPEPTRRGTLNILVTCLITLGISIWSALRLNILGERLSRMKRVMRKSLWAAIGLFLPEILIRDALDQLFGAHEIRDTVNKHFGFPTQEPWYRRMFHQSATRLGKQSEKGPEVTRFSSLFHYDDVSLKSLMLPQKTGPIGYDLYTAGVMNASGKIVPRKHRWTTAHGFYAAMGGFAIGEQSPSGTVIEKVLSPRGFLTLLQERPDLIPEIIPDIPEEAIHDKGKCNTLAKAILIVQVAWFCINCISRVAQGLCLTLLEISTLAHTLCAVAVFVLWWDKPLNVTEHTIIPHPGIELDRRSKGWFHMEHEVTESIARKSNHRWPIALIIVGLFYGAPHALAWKASFPTHIEQLLWQASTLSIIAAPWCFAFLLSFLNFVEDTTKVSSEKAILLTGIVTGLVYFPASLYLIASSLRQLFFLPPDAFELPVWTNYFPHIS